MQTSPRERGGTRAVIRVIFPVESWQNSQNAPQGSRKPWILPALRPPRPVVDQFVGTAQHVIDVTPPTLWSIRILVGVIGGTGCFCFTFLANWNTPLLEGMSSSHKPFKSELLTAPELGSGYGFYVFRVRGVEYGSIPTVTLTGKLEKSYLILFWQI